MTDPHIRAALEVAACQLCFGSFAVPPPNMTPKQYWRGVKAPARARYQAEAMQTIIAFLRAMPKVYWYPISPEHVRGITAEALRALADAVERAGQSDERSG